MLSSRRMFCAALVLAGSSWLTMPARAVEPKLLPSNTEIVVTINIKQILDSEVVKAQKELINQLKAAVESRVPDDRAIKYLEKIGFDPFKDLYSVSIAHNGSKDVDDLFVVVEGKFNQEKLHAVAKEAAAENGESLRITKIGDVNVYEVRPGGDKTVYVAPVGKTMVVTPNQDLLKEAIKRSASDAQGAPKVRDLLKTTNDTQSLSFVITGAALTNIAEQAQKAKGLQNNPFAAGLQGIEGISGAVTIAKNVNFQLGVGAKGADIAKDMVNLGNNLLPLVKGLVAQEAKKNPDLAPAVDVMDTLKLSSVGPNVILTGEVTYANLEKLIKAASNLKGQFGN